MNESRQRKKRRLKRFLIVLLVLVIIGNCGAAFAGHVIFSFIVDTESDFSVRNIQATLYNVTHPLSAKVTAAPAPVDTSPWLGGKAEDMYITVDGDITLHAYHAINREANANGNYVIMCHGYSASGSFMTTYAEHFYSQGYSILSPDLRAHGQSGGRYIGMGWLDRLDMLCWIDKIIETAPTAKIILFGISMGAATVMNTAGEDLPENVIAAIEDSGFTSVFDIVEHQLWGYRVPPVPFLYIASVMSEVRAGYSFKDASCVSQVAKSKIPMLFIHGTQDGVVPFRMLDEVYNTANCEKEKLAVQGAGHIRSVEQDPTLYWSTVDAFLEKYI